jgi:hypothetical protein
MKTNIVRISIIVSVFFILWNLFLAAAIEGMSSLGGITSIIPQLLLVDITASLVLVFLVIRTKNKILPIILIILNLLPTIIFAFPGIISKYF